MTFRDHAEAGFERWGRFIFRHGWATIVLTLAFSGVLISQLPRITVEMSTEGFLHPDDPTLLVYNAFRNQFERDDRALIAIKTDHVFDLEFLAKLRDFHEALESEVPQLDEIDSLVNARNTRGDEDELIVEDLFEDWPEDQAALERIKQFAFENPLYPNLLISEDLSYTTVALKFDTYSSLGKGAELEGFEEEDGFADSSETEQRYLTGDENNAIMAVVRQVMARFEGPGFEIYISGSPVFDERISTGVTGDLRRFLVLAFLATGVFLFILFRRPSGTFLPLFVVLLSLLTTLGFMPLLGMQLQVPTQILPAFLMSVGVGDSVHILAIFYQRLRHGENKEDALAFSLGHSGLAVLMTSATTAGALMSFLAAELAPIAHLGMLAPIGVTLALIYTVALLPALLAVTPLREGRRGAPPPLRFLDRVLVGFGDLSTGHPWKVIIGFSASLVLGAMGAAQLRFSHNPMAWFRQGDEIRTDTELLNQELKGVMPMEVLFDTRQQNGLHDPLLLGKLDQITRLNATLEADGIFVGKTISLVDILKEIHQALNENRSDFYAIPQDRLLVAQELLLFENSGSDDLEDVVDSQFSVARMTLKIPWTDAIAYPSFIETIQQSYEGIVGDATTITVTGRVPLLSRTFTAVISSMSRSYIIAFLVITPLMILLLSSFKWGLLSMIPNLTPILITLGVMGWFDFPLDGFTLLIGSVAIGLAVDDTIHFMHNFRRYYDRMGDAREAVHETLQTTGQALLFTTLVLCTGFFIFMLGSMRSTFNFGFLTGFALAIALLANVTLAPALMTLVTRRSERRSRREPGLDRTRKSVP
jgi:predicted RND superfamily exporter protein